MSVPSVIAEATRGRVKVSARTNAPRLTGKKWVKQKKVSLIKTETTKTVRASKKPAIFKTRKQQEEQQLRLARNDQAARGLIATASRYLKTVYIMGGASPGGFDCSGFTHYVFRKHGINLPRTSIEQAQRGITVDADHLRMGDLVFFSTIRKGVSHVGIFISKGLFIHSAADGVGVTMNNMFTRYWQDRFVTARRVNLANGQRYVLADQQRKRST